MAERVCFVGAGSMAESIIAGIVHNQYVTGDHIVVTNKHNQERLGQLEKDYNIKATTDKQTAIEGADIIILATKPGDLNDAIDQIDDYVQSEQLIISVVAGIPTSVIQNHFAIHIPVVRVMPNTSASIGYSATAITAGASAGETDVQLAESLFQTIGSTVVVEEKDMHTVTGISGSGPAYFYYVVEAMEKAATESGLDREVAKDLITQTIIGAGEMLKHSGDEAHELREKITSPGGTTQAAIDTLQANDFEKTVMKAVKRARERSMELGGE